MPPGSQLRSPKSSGPRRPWYKRPGIVSPIIGAIIVAGGSIAGAIIAGGSPNSPLSTASSTTTSSINSPTVSPTTTSLPTTSAPVASPVIAITSPADSAIVHTTTILVAGTSTQALASGHEIWIVVQPVGAGRYYPQLPSATITASLVWTAPNVALGGKDTFVIYAVDADSSVTAAFQTYFQQHPHSFPGMTTLPPGTRVVDKITISRQ